MTSARFHVGRAKRAGSDGAATGLGKALEYLLAESRQLVPLEEGTLMRSGATVQEGARGAVYYDTPY